MQSCNVWHEHWEPCVSDNVPHLKTRDKQDHDVGGIDALVEDRIREELTDGPQREEVRNFQKLLNDSQRELYPGSVYFVEVCYWGIQYEGNEALNR